MYVCIYGKGANSTETNLTESDYQLRKIICNHMWKLSAALEGPLLLSMEIALPHVISHTKAFLSTVTQFAYFALKGICDGTAMLGRWICFWSLVLMNNVRIYNVSHHRHKWSSLLKCIWCMTYHRCLLLFGTVVQMHQAILVLYVCIFIFICVCVCLYTYIHTYSVVFGHHCYERGTEEPQSDKVNIWSLTVNENEVVNNLLYSL